MHFLDAMHASRNCSLLWDSIQVCYNSLSEQGKLKVKITSFLNGHNRWWLFYFQGPGYVDYSVIGGYLNNKEIKNAIYYSKLLKALANERKDRSLKSIDGLKMSTNKDQKVIQN